MPDTPEPEPHPLARAFSHVYLSADEKYWSLPPRARSLETLRRLFAVSRSFRMPRRLHITTHPHVNPTEYVRMAALAGTSDADVDAFLADFHARHSDHPYAAALFDPLGRHERWP
jgi:hypothetical protein